MAERENPREADRSGKVFCRKDHEAGGRGGSPAGPGQKRRAEKETAGKAQQASEEFEKAYSTYLDSNGMDDFQNGLFGYMLDLYTADETWEISETEIMKDNDAYKFRVSMNVGDTPQEIQGRAEVNDGKIGNLDITEL